MPWNASLQLDYTLEAGRCVARFAHEGPLRILQSLYPEGDSVCHNVLVHPPGGLVGGDTLKVAVSVGAGAHGLITTPGATRFYRSAGELAQQTLHAQLASQAKLEWLPLEALAYNQCQAENRAVFELAASAELLAWDVTALGLPSAQLPFEQGVFSQHLEVPGLWLERGRVDAADLRLMNSALGLAGHRCMASLIFVAGEPLARSRREQALECARAVLKGHGLEHTAGVTAPNPQMVMVRLISPLVEQAMNLLKSVRTAWRNQLWGMSDTQPRIWAT